MEEDTVTSTHAHASTMVVSVLAGGLGGKYPAGFYSGTGGLYDDLQAALRTTVATTYLKVRRAPRLGET